MNENNTLRFWKWAVTLLILCNICLIAVIWLKPGLPFGHHPETPRDFVIRNLKFSDTQVKTYDSLINLQKITMNQLRKESAGYRRQLFDNLKNNGQNSLSPDSLSQLIANDQKQIELTTYNHFAQVRTICTDGQKAIFDKIIGDVTRMMAAPPAGHHGHPPGDNQGPPPPNGPPPPQNQPGPPEND